jgi:hypothetical protein
MSPDRYVDNFGQRPRGATPAERQRGLALVDGIDHVRRALAAVGAAATDEPHGGRLQTLEEAAGLLRRVLAKLDLLR